MHITCEGCAGSKVFFYRNAYICMGSDLMAEIGPKQSFSA